MFALLSSALLAVASQQVPTHEDTELDCRRSVAPINVQAVPARITRSGMPGNSGPRLQGFVDLPGGRPSVPGIDVSKYQDETNFNAARVCGARFAYVRLSAGTQEANESQLFRLHWAAARDAGLLTGPYHNMSFLPARAKSWASATADAKDGLMRAIMNDAAAIAQMQADIFLDHLDQVLRLQTLPDRLTETDVPAFLPIALDLSYDPLPGATAEDRRAYGAVIGRMACEFIARVHARPKTKTSAVILFVSADFWRDYDLAQNTCGLADLPVWISYHLASAGAPSPDDPMERKDLDRLCRPDSRPDRCIFQQYSSYGGFALYRNDAVLDVNRFFGSEADLRSHLQLYR
ncbi:glycoside hydrolase family 25 protein [Sphingomonas sp. OTU376]|uniref:glycoside hydrolase family 25 protein n=1 Tax=Sphingomonas sp. OTU376 TaxID=3043863 RepID=UPI00313BDE1B